MKKFVLAGLGLLLVLSLASGADAQSWVSSKQSFITRVDTICTNRDLANGASIDLELGYIGHYWEIYVKFLATTFDTATVYVGSSENETWATGRTAYFDRDPATVAVDNWSIDDGLGTYGTCIPLMNTYGAYLPGPYGVMKITASDTDTIEALTVILIKRK